MLAKYQANRDKIIDAEMEMLDEIENHYQHYSSQLKATAADNSK